jgi:asparagine synthase (glutamine-hydrolysing)
MPDVARRPIFEVAATVYPKLDWAPKVLRAKSTLAAISKNSIDGYLSSLAISTDQLRAKLYSKTFRDNLAGYHARTVLHDHLKNAEIDDSLSRVQYLDIKTYLCGDILTKVDRASMAHGLEVRVPFLDHEFVEWVAGLPSTLKLSGRNNKAVLKSALETLLPRGILYRPKMGFAVPLAAWFRGPLRQLARSMILSREIKDSGIFDCNRLEHVLRNHESGIRDYSQVIWALVMFCGFLRENSRNS